MKRNYSLSLNPLWMGGLSFGTQLLKDGRRDTDQELDALIRSGDYFATLAATIEAITQTLGEDQLNEVRPEVFYKLDKIINDLEYAQRNYEIVSGAKSPDSS